MTGLWRKKARTIFTLLSIVVALLLYGMLQGIDTSFNQLVDSGRLNVLVTTNPAGLPLPLADLSRIEAVPGVTGVTYRSLFVGYYQTVNRESDYFAAQSRGLNAVLKVIGYFIGGMMAVGALVISVLVEALLLAVTGALLGALCAWLFFDGHVTSMMMGGLQTPMSFALAVTPGLVVLGIVWACVIGLIGGLFPAIRAARLPVAAALRAS